MDLVQDFQHHNKLVKIYYNPIEDYDTAVVVGYWGDRYILGNKKIDRFSKEELIAEHQNDPILAILPMYAYIHSGVTVSTEPFGCQWDSGQSGWAYITQSSADKMGYEGLSTEELEDIIRQEVKSYDNYLTGQVYLYDVQDLDGSSLESCGGFIGDLEGCIADAKIVAERLSTS
jgi:hypothetical protein